MIHGLGLHHLQVVVVQPLDCAVALSPEQEVRWVVRACVHLDFTD